MIRWIWRYSITLVGSSLGNVLARSNWKWGSVWKAPRFDDMFQLQHLQIVIQVPRDQIAIPLREILEVKV